MVKTLKERSQQCITKLYFENEFKSINQMSKLRTYKLFKSDYKLQNYVNICYIPLKWRKMYCAFRISCHDLEIERGRYIRPHVPPEKRICKLCHKESETEENFILHCNVYLDLRENLLKNCCLYYPNFPNMDNKCRFQYLLNSKSEYIINIRSNVRHIYHICI